jgi:hypothetical protein
MTKKKKPTQLDRIEQRGGRPYGHPANKKYLSENETDVNDSLGRIEAQPAKIFIDIAEMRGDVKHLVQSIDDLKLAFDKSCVRIQDAEMACAVNTANLNTAGQEISRLRGTQNTYTVMNAGIAFVMAAIAGIVGYFK